MKPHIPLNLTKLPLAGVVERLQVGDPFTFIVSEPLTAEHPTDENTVVNLVPGDYFSRRFSDGDITRAFRITEVTVYADGTLAYETVYTGVHHHPE